MGNKVKTINVHSNIDFPIAGPGLVSTGPVLLDWSG